MIEMQLDDKRKLEAGCVNDEDWTSAILVSNVEDVLSQRLILFCDILLENVMTFAEKMSLVMPQRVQRQMKINSEMEANSVLKLIKDC